MTFADPFAQSASSQANVARALSELRRGGAIAISAGNETAIAIAAELIEEPGFAWATAPARAVPAGVSGERGFAGPLNAAQGGGGAEGGGGWEGGAGSRPRVLMAVEGALRLGRGPPGGIGPSPLLTPPATISAD